MNENKCETIINQYYGCCGGIGTGADNEYSTEETICGTWIDGKPIYRKVYLLNGAIPNNKNNYIDVSDIVNMERVINLRGTILNTATKSFGFSPLPYCTTINGEIRTISLYYTDTKEICIRSEVPTYSLSDAVVCIEYTKTV